MTPYHIYPFCMKKQRSFCITNLAYYNKKDCSWISVGNSVKGYGLVRGGRSNIYSTYTISKSEMNSISKSETLKEREEIIENILE